MATKGSASFDTRNDIAWDLSTLGSDIWSTEVAEVIVKGDRKDWLILFPSMASCSRWTSGDFNCFAFTCLMAYRHMMPKNSANAQTIAIEGHGRRITLDVPQPQPPFIGFTLKLYELTSIATADDILTPARPDYGYLLAMIRLSLHHEMIRQGVAEQTRISNVKNSKVDSSFVRKHNNEAGKLEIVLAIKDAAQAHSKKTLALPKAAQKLGIGKSVLYDAIKELGLSDEVNKLFE